MNDSYYPKGTDLSFTPISPEEERELFRKAKLGDAAAKEQIIRNHLLLVANMSRSFAKGKLPEEDVISAGNFSLMAAFENYNPELNNRFSSFLTLYVRGAIARLWHEQNLVSKTDFSDGEPVVSVPLSDETADESGTPDSDHHALLLKLQKESRCVLDERENKIIDMIFNENPMSQAEVSRVLKITRERVRQVYDVAIAKMGRELRRRMNEHHINQ